MAGRSEAIEMARMSGGLLLLTQYHHPVPNFVSRDIAEMMTAHGPVTVITAHPNYPHGRFYPGTRWWRPERTVENGVVVWRLPMIPDQSNSILRRSLSYLSFLAIATIWAPFVASRPAVVWVYQTPFTTAVAALWFRLTGSRLVYTVADLWPESFAAAEVTKPGRLMRLLFAWRRATNRWADAIICSTRGTLERFAAEGVQPDRLLHVPVWVQGADRAGDEPTAQTRSIVYAGNMGPAQALDTVIRAAALLEPDGIDVNFDLYGTGSAEPELRALAERLGVRNVRFHGRVAPESAFRASAAALGQIVSLRPSPLFRMTVPSKLAFCFAAGAPILYGLEGEAAEIAAASGGAIGFDPRDPQSLADAVRELAGRDAEEVRRVRRVLRAYFADNFERGRLLAAYEEALTNGAAPRRSVPDADPAGGTAAGALSLSRRT